MDRLDSLKDFISSQIKSLDFSKDSLDQRSEMFIDLIINNRDKGIFFTGVGKAGLIARVVSSSMTSMGFRSIYVYPNELMHGELGQIKPGDLVIFVSKSGETEELKDLVSHLRLLGAKLALITTNSKSGISKFMDLTVPLQITSEHLLNGLAPSTSNIAFLTYFYGILSVLVTEINFTANSFAKLHPSGLIGKRLNMSIAYFYDKGITEYIREESSFIEILSKLSTSNFGGVVVLDQNQKLLGVISDGDIRRLLINKPINDIVSMDAKQLMNKDSVSANINEPAYLVFNKMRNSGISFVPVLDKDESFVFSLGIGLLYKEGFHD
jgi:arabinose-5-phosphate isomerase